MSDFETEWARCAPWLDGALDHCGRTHDLADVKAMVIAGDATFWNGHKAALVTELCEFPRFKAINFWLGGGDLAELRDVLVPLVERTYAAQGCRYATINGRQGWAKALGYTPLYWTCAKDLTP